MDKNTLFGMLLMGAVIFGFMWLNQPTPEDIEAQRQQQIAQAEKRQLKEQAALFGDTLSAGDINRLAALVSTYGTQDGGNVATFNNENVNLTVAEGKLSGFVTVNDSVISFKEVAAVKVLTPMYAEAVKSVRNAISSLGRYRDFATALAGEDSTVVLENNLIKLELASKGGVISSATLKEYDDIRNEQLVLFSREDNSYSFTLNSTDTRYETKDFYFKPVAVNDSTIKMSVDLHGAEFAIQYTLPSDSYLVKMEILQKDMSKVIPSNITDMGFQWHQKMIRHEKGRMFEERNSTIYYKYFNGDVNYLTETSAEEETLNERVKWVAFKDQFFSSILIPDKYFSGAHIVSTPFDKGSVENVDYVKDLHTTADLEYSSELSNPATFHFFFGPNRYPLLSSYDDVIGQGEDLDLTNIIPLGWSFFRWINTILIIPIFNLLGGFIGNFGIVILILTLIVKLILFPFTYKSMISQAKMRILAPDIKALNDKYPGNENAMVRQQKTMALYSQAGASPFSGCLPILLQMPILFAMFTFFPSCIDLRGESFLWVADLSAPDAIVSWDAQIPFITNYFGNHISLFCLLMTVTNILYTHINMQNQPSGNQMPGMKIMMYAMPVMFLVFFNNYAAGLSYYYFISLLITIIQTYAFRHFVSEEKVRARMATAAKKPKKKSGFMARLEEAQRQQQAALREQQKRNKR